MRLLILLTLFLAGCGIAGVPERPAAPAEPEERTSPGVTVSGDARIGVVRG